MPTRSVFSERRTKTLAPFGPAKLAGIQSGSAVAAGSESSAS